MEGFISPDRLELHIQGIRRGEVEDTLRTKGRRGTSLEGQWLRLRTAIPQAAWCRGKKRQWGEKRDFSFTGNLTLGTEEEKDECSGAGEFKEALVHSVDSHSGGAMLLSAETHMMSGLFISALLPGPSPATQNNKLYRVTWLCWSFASVWWFSP